MSIEVYILLISFLIFVGDRLAGGLEYWYFEYVNDAFVD